jgi:hypothetical protein
VRPERGRRNLKLYFQIVANCQHTLMIAGLTEFAANVHRNDFSMAKRLRPSCRAGTSCDLLPANGR